MKPLSLGTTTTALDAMHRAADRARKGTVNIPVNRDALMALLIDHSKMAAQLGELGLRPKEGER